MRGARERLEDIIEAIAHIERHTGGSRENFDRDELIQVWTVHPLQIIGEAASALDRGFYDAHREIAWPQIVALRNVLVHNYFGIDLNELWNVVQRDLPQLKLWRAF